MNPAIERIKFEAMAQLTPKKEKYNGADVDGDENRTKDFFNNLGGKFEVTSGRNKFERWDIEGIDHHGQKTWIEVKTRPAVNTYDTWIIDTYKVDWMLNEFPHDPCYFVNVCQGEYHVYDMRYIATAPQKPVTAKMWNGTTQAKNFYFFKKDMFLTELSKGVEGKGAEFNEIFKT